MSVLVGLLLVGVLQAGSGQAGAGQAGSQPGGPPAPGPAVDLSTLDAATFESELRRRFQYPPPPPPAELADPRAGQVADADYLQAYPDYDRAYSAPARAEAHRRLAALKAEAAGLTHEQFVLRVAEIAALADNGHTAIGGAAFLKNTTRLPLRTYWFADGLHVLQAGPEVKDLLGARIDAIDGRPIEQVFQGLRHYVGGTDTHRRLELTPVFESPGLLQAAGLARSRDALVLAGVRADGSRFEQRIFAEERGRAAPISNEARLLFPLSPDGPMVSVLTEGGALPVALRDHHHLFSMAPLEHGGLYIALGANMDEEGESISDFLASARTRMAQDKPAFVVLDMRLNEGGDYTKTYAFARDLPKAVGPTGRIYLLTSGWTFSAAISASGAVKQFGKDQVTIIGEPVGDRLKFWAESGGAFRLPNAFFSVFYATGQHDYTAPCTDTNDCFWLNRLFPVRVTTLAPDIPAPRTFEAYRRGEDPAMTVVYRLEAVVRPAKPSA